MAPDVLVCRSTENNFQLSLKSLLFLGNEGIRDLFTEGEVSDLLGKTMVNNSHAFNLSNCSVVFV